MIKKFGYLFIIWFIFIPMKNFQPAKQNDDWIKKMIINQPKKMIELKKKKGYHQD